MLVRPGLYTSVFSFETKFILGFQAIMGHTLVYVLYWHNYSPRYSWESFLFIKTDITISPRYSWDSFLFIKTKLFSSLWFLFVSKKLQNECDLYSMKSEEKHSTDKIPGQIRTPRSFSDPALICQILRVNLFLHNPSLVFSANERDRESSIFYRSFPWS